MRRLLVVLALTAVAAAACKGSSKSGGAVDDPTGKGREGVPIAQILEEGYAKAPPNGFLKRLRLWVEGNGVLYTNSGGVEIGFGTTDAKQPAEGAECPKDCVVYEWKWQTKWKQLDKVCCYLAPEYRLDKPHCTPVEVREHGAAQGHAEAADSPTVMELQRTSGPQNWLLWAGKTPIDLPDDCN